ncbi:MAG: energy-coupling factor transporter transmembrane component T [Actinomycetota bacterium]|nr:energy-coupling factor transporter transmembrane component T [Actinomycetota bacterium]
MENRRISVGKFMPVKSLLHDLDPRLKIVSVIAGMVFAFMYSKEVQILAFLAFFLVLLILAKMPVLPLLKSIRTVWVIILLTFLLQAFLAPGEVLWHWGALSITDTGITNGIILSGRIIILVLLLSMLTMTTSPVALTDALESIALPLRKIGVQTRHFTTVVRITLMFVPNMFEKSQKIIRAQTARGADFKSANIARRARNLLPILVPLFVKLFNDADELAIAMYSRAYDCGARRTRLHPLKIRGGDVAFTALFIGIATMIKVFL